MDKKTTAIFSAATALVLALLLTAVVKSNQTGDKGFTPPPFEVNAQTGEITDVGEFYGSFDLPFEDNNRCTVGLDAMPNVDNDEIAVNFSSDKDNTVWVRLLITDENDELVAESGVLRPGEYVTALSLSKMVSSGSTLKAKILTFEPETYYSAGSAKTTLKIK